MEEKAYLSLVFPDKTHLPVRTWRISSVPFDGQNHIHKTENLASGRTAAHIPESKMETVVP